MAYCGSMVLEDVTAAEIKNLQTQLARAQKALKAWHKNACEMTCCDHVLDLMNETEIILGIRNPDGSEK